MSYKKAKLYEIHTREEWIRDYGAGSENYVRPTLDPTVVPESVRSLVRFAEIFGIRDDVTRGDFIGKQSDASLREFCDAVEGRKAALDGFLHALPKGVQHWPETAKHFLYLKAAYAEAHGELYVCRKAPRDEAET